MSIEVYPLRKKKKSKCSPPKTGLQWEVDYVLISLLTLQGYWRSWNSKTCLLATRLITKHWWEKIQRLKFPLPRSKTKKTHQLFHSSFSSVRSLELRNKLYNVVSFNNYAWVMSPYFYLVINILTVLCYFLYSNFKTLKSQKQRERLSSLYVRFFFPPNHCTYWKILYEELLKSHIKHSSIFLCPNQISLE